jgi:phosphatidylserine decarboxylase
MHSSNDFIGEVTLSMSDLVDRAPKPDPKSGLYAHRDGQVVGDQLHEYRLALVPSKTEELDAKKACEITVRAKYTPYAAVRQQFWRRYLQQYGALLRMRLESR